MSDSMAFTATYDLKTLVANRTVFDMTGASGVVDLGDGVFAVSGVGADGNASVQTFDYFGTELSRFGFAGAAPSIAALGDGKVAVATVGAGGALTFKVIDAAGNALVDVSGGAGFSDPSIAALGGGEGGFVIASTHQGEVEWSTYSAAGAVTHSRTIARPPGHTVDNVSVTGLASGSFVVAWDDVAADGARQAQYAAFSTDGEEEYSDTLGAATSGFVVIATTGNDYLGAYEDTNNEDINAYRTYQDGASYQTFTPEMLGGFDRKPALGLLSNGILATAFTNELQGDGDLDIRIVLQTATNVFIPGDHQALTNIDNPPAVAITAAAEDDPAVAGLSGNAAFALTYTDASTGETMLGVYQMRRTSTGTEAAETFTGDEAADIVFGEGGADTLNGGGGGDVLNGGAGRDTLNGGDGVDTADYSDATGSIRVDLAVAGFQSVGGGQDADRLVSIEQLVGSGFGDTLIGKGGGVIRGGAGDDRLVGAGGDVVFGDDGSDTLTGRAGVRLFGGAGDDVYYLTGGGSALEERLTGIDEGGVDTVVSDRDHALGAYIEKLRLTGSARTGIGNELDNALTGNAAANILDGGEGADVMAGLGGADLYRVDSARDRVVEAAGGGVDVVLASVSYTLAAGQEIEKLYTADDAGAAAIRLNGNAIANVLKGNAGANVLDGGGGADSLFGLGGDDAYFVDDAGDRVIEGADAGLDTVFAAADYTLGAAQAIERLFAAAGTAPLALAGNEIANTVRGNAGANVMDGGAGADLLTGLGGQDTFVFRHPNAVDRVTDFSSADDTIRLSRQAFGALPAGALDPATFKDIRAAAVDDNDRILYDSRTGALFYDADGSGETARVQFARLDGAPAIGAADFVIV